MIRLDNISLQRAGQFLLHESDLTIYPGQHVGITGANGSGKTSLFKLLCGELSVDKGEVSLPNNLSISYMKQEVEYASRNAVEHVIDGDIELRELEAELQRAEERAAHDRIASIHERLSEIDGYTAQHRAEQLLHGLGFSQSDCERQADTFSGGWRIRLNLAQVLMKPGSILLLDEPTNHLDLDATLWLEQWLKNYKGTLLLISHDRDFLDSCVGFIAHIEHKRIHYNRGNYSDFEGIRAEQLAQQQAMYEKQQQRIAEIRKFVTRFRAKATKAKQAQSRIKELNRMEIISAAHVDSPFSFQIPEAEKKSDPLLSLKSASVTYAEIPILENVNFSIHPGDCIGLLGANGAGKSTLIKTMLGELNLLQGEIVKGEHLKTGYFAQHQLEELDLDASPYLHLQRLSPQASEQEIRNYLGSFNFRGDKALEIIRPFSGGEKARLALAIVAWQKPNLLLLDEPTNHLDLEMRHALTLALQAFNGAMVLISHDRHLLRNCVDRFLIVKEGGVEEYAGDLTEYEALISKKQTASPGTANGVREKTDSKAERRESAQRRAKLSPLMKKIDDLERTIKAQQRLLKDTENKLADETIYEKKNALDLQALLKEQGLLKQKIKEHEDNWLRYHEELESLQ